MMMLESRLAVTSGPEDTAVCYWRGLATMNTLGNLKKIRRAKGLSQRDLSEMASLNQATISKCERGDDGITLRAMNRLAEALQVPTVALFDMDDATLRVVMAMRTMSPEKARAALLVIESMKD